MLLSQLPQSNINKQSLKKKNADLDTHRCSARFRDQILSRVLFAAAGPYMYLAGWGSGGHLPLENCEYSEPPSPGTLFDPFWQTFCTIIVAIINIKIPILK